MGHLRVGVLPKNKKWSAVVSSIGSFTGAEESIITDIAEKTLDASKKAFRELPHDQAVKSCYQFLVALSVAGQSVDVKSAAQGFGIDISDEPTKLQLSRALRDWLSKNPPQNLNSEFASLARKATLDTIADWLNKHLSKAQTSLLPQTEDPYQPWRAASPLCQYR